MATANIIAANIATIRAARKQRAPKELIKAATIARVTDKVGKLLGWGVKSNHEEKYYQVTCAKIAGECVWFCTCCAGQHGFTGCKDGKCAHVKAVIEVGQARKELAQAAPLS
ncbi:MAG TPA: hypothetical protein VH164_01770 [Ktedonobacteraceae bacterium]|jgi:hypothetical protein|nr:hypothetical protein [Ktedonobacteraceae bacterium]